MFSLLIRFLSIFDLKKVNFKYKKIGMEKLNKKESCLILMNHSSFIDLKIASKLLFPRKYNIVATDDGLVGKKLLMKLIGCIPTKKFIMDISLVRDMSYAVKKLKTSILLFPEAGYSFDGTSTTLPKTLGKCLKFLKVPVVMIETNGAYLRDPLYNNLQLRKVDVSATMTYILSVDDIENKSVEELNQIIEEKFNFDNFKKQIDNHVKITESFRADYLNRVLYKCPTCLKEGMMEGKGTKLTCHNCNKEYELTEYGQLKALDNINTFNHIPDWYKWQRECVKQEIMNNNYKLDLDVQIYILKNYKCIYQIEDGHLTHDINGFHLTNSTNTLDYYHDPKTSYSLNSDYFWYEIGDVICIGNDQMRYYCVSKNKKDVVTKARLATEEIYKLLQK